jgi:hypothetical protein
VIRLRRLRTRFPWRRLYELEYQPLGDPDSGWLAVTRSPLYSLLPCLGIGDAWSFVHEADRQLRDGNTDWAVEFEERAPLDVQPRRPKPLRVGWGWLVAHATVVVLMLMGYYTADIGVEPEDGANIGKGLMAMTLFLPGLPWSIATWDETWGNDDEADLRFELFAFTPAVVNVAIHLGFRLYVWRRIQAWRA